MAGQQEDFGTIVQKRSPLRCHLLSRIPIFNKYGEAKLYELKFTAGNMLALDRLEDKHVYHIMFGFMIRRSIESFVGKGNIGAIRMPVTETLYQNLHLYSPDKLCIIIPYNQEPTENAMAYIKLLRKAGVHFAIDLTKLFAGDFKEVSNCFDYILADFQDHFVEKVVLYHQMVERTNNLINLIGHNIHSQQESTDALDCGSTHILCKFYKSPNATSDSRFDETTLREDINVLLNEVFKDEPDYQRLAKIIGDHPFMVDLMLHIIDTLIPNPDQEIKNISQAVAYLGTEQLRSFICLSCAEAITSQCVSSQSEGRANLATAHELLRYSLIRSKFISELCAEYADVGTKRHAFQVGMFSVVDGIMDATSGDALQSGLHTLVQNDMHRHGLLSILVDCISALENQDLQGVIKAVNAARIPINAVLKSFEDSILWSNLMFSLLMQSRK